MRDGRSLLIEGHDVNEEFESLMAAESLTRIGFSLSSSSCTSGSERDSGEYHVEKRDDVRGNVCR